VKLKYCNTDLSVKAAKPANMVHEGSCEACSLIANKCSVQNIDRMKLILKKMLD
jgi:multimeric flavodoxin WrbA